MAGERTKLYHLGLDRDIASEHAQPTGAIGQRRAARPARLEPGQQDRVPTIPAKALQVMQDASAGQHAAGGNDDHRALARVQRLGLFDRVHARGNLEHGAAIGAADVMFFMMPVVDLGRVHRHRAVEIDRNIGNVAPPHQTRDMQHQPLCTAHRKRRDQRRAATGKGAFQDRCQFGLGIDIGMRAVSVGGFANQHIGPAKRFRRPHQRIRVMSQIAAEVYNPPTDFQPDLGRPQKMPGRDESGGDTFAQRDRRVEGVAVEPLQRRHRILPRIKRFRVLVLGKALAGGIARLFFLDMAAVRQDQPAKLCRGVGTQNAPPEPAPDQRGQIAGMIQMGVGQQHGVYRGRAHRERLAVAGAQLFEPLEQAAIHKNAPARGLDQIARSRHRTRSAQKAQFRTSHRHHDLVPRAAMALNNPPKISAPYHP